MTAPDYSALLDKLDALATEGFREGVPMADVGVIDAAAAALRAGAEREARLRADNELMRRWHNVKPLRREVAKYIGKARTLLAWRRGVDVSTDMICAEWSGRIGGTNQRLGKARDGHLYATKPYAGFREGLAWALRAKKAGRALIGFVAVRIDFVVDQARDLDSGIKGALDALQDSGLIADDRQVQRLEVTRRTHPRGELDRVRLAVGDAS